MNASDFCPVLIAVAVPLSLTLIVPLLLAYKSIAPPSASTLPPLRVTVPLSEYTAAEELPVAFIFELAPSDFKVAPAPFATRPTTPVPSTSTSPSFVIVVVVFKMTNRF